MKAKPWPSVMRRQPVIYTFVLHWRDGTITKCHGKDVLDVLLNSENRTLQYYERKP